ncbi:MAG: DUF1553 domain-containing protein [Bryobacterales bacterium]|nr:DUF1553 domain-containing protein [Bryobacterales bacterium]
MMDLRLDTKEGAFSVRKSGAAIVPFKPDASLLIQRIEHAKEALRMPPKQSHKTITDAQKRTLRQWIAQGAPWSEHWAFRAPVRPALPAVRNARWVRNAIDRFILARLEANNLLPAREADRRTIARRLSLDLTGLPPEPAAVDAFVADKRPDAYERYVDSLLESPRWGEHRGRYWLDAARYGDTHGIHVDNYREMWPYRDWVIQAFNRNQPFDRFVIEQIAGDLLPNRTLEQQIASGFHRCNVTTNEAGVITEEIEAMYAKDRVDTTGTVFLGLTVGCATCHDHKFDPISQRDFYSMAAFFRNTTQSAMDGNIHDTPPMIVVPRAEDRPRWYELAKTERDVKTRMETARSQRASQLDTWLAAPERRSIAGPLGKDAQLFALDVSPNAKLAADVTYEATERPAIRFGEKAKLEYPSQYYFTADLPFSISAWIYFPKGEGSFAIASQADAKDKNRGWVLEVAGRVPSLRLTGDDGKSLQVRTGHLVQLKPGNWYHLAASYDGTREKDGIQLYIDGKLMELQGSGDPGFRLPGDICNQSPLRIGNEGSRYFPGGAIADLRIYNRAITEDEAVLISRWPAIEAAVAKETPALTQEEREAFTLYYLHTKDDQFAGYKKELAAITSERREIRRRGGITHVMQERADQQPFAHILYRGMYDQPRAKVEPSTPSVLPPMPASLPKNRLGLAEWLVSPEHPLLSRVTVNRFWQEVFGTGLVKTAEDFGSQGEAPSHPELLDWLAVEFRESGWDVKKFYKLLVTSAAYRQEATASEDKLKKDPDNRMLSRGPRFRMDAEMVRDYALSASGLLRPDIGGPSVRPYQPEGVWEAVAMVGSNTRFYKPDQNDKLYRRSMYTFWKRSAPPANMDIFNAPTRETCTVRRERTNTPLQALVTMNDVQFVEAARNLAQRAYQTAPQQDSRFQFMAGRLLARSLDVKELDVTRRAYRDYLTYYDSHPEDAKRLVKVGDSRVEATIPAPDFAALTMVANQLMNLDEVLTK